MIEAAAFREVASDPVAWRTKAATLRSAAQSLWDSGLGFFVEGAGQTMPAKQRAEVVGLFSERLHTSKLLYGLATEAGLKARIIALDPANITFIEKKDGNGAIVDVRIERIGAALAGDGHDLLKLAEIAGVIGQGDARVFTIDSDQEAIHEILAFLTDCVRWSGRYPAPRRAVDHYRPTHAIPRVVVGHYMRDWLDPFLDALLRQVRPQP